MQEFSFDRASKFTAKDRFFDINYVWTPGLSWVVEKLYYTSVRPETIVVLSLVAGALSGWLYAKGDYLFSLLGILFIQLKNYLDTVDGHIARAKGIASRFGRFLDSLADALAYLFLFTGIAVNLASGGLGYGVYFLSYATMLTGFLLCSVYCFYLVSYKTQLSGIGINRVDESVGEDEKEDYGKDLSGRCLLIMHHLYLLIYGWQDKIVAAMDKKSLEKAGAHNLHLNEGSLKQIWYTDKRFLSSVAPLCFGTQIMLLSIFTVFDNLYGYLWFLIVAGNGYYTLFLVYGRSRRKITVHS